MLAAGKNWVIDRLQELQTRLGNVRTPGQSVPVVQSAAIDKSALNALESGMRKSAAVLVREIDELLRSTERLGAGRSDRLEAANKKLALLQLRADSLFTTFDLLQDATAVRADAKTGRMLRGVDILLQHALRRPIPGYTPPLAVSYLDSSGRGGAIARARTRLPGGFVLGAALVRVSPESLPMRLSSILHEAGHQLSVDLQLLDEARLKIARVVYRLTGQRAAAKLYASWASELLADCWGVVLSGGAPAVDGLQRVLSLPEELLYSIRAGAPHPAGPVRIHFADAASRLVYPDPALKLLKLRFEEIYGTPTITESLRGRLHPLLAATPRVARALMAEPFKGLGGKTLTDCGERWLVHPTRVRKILPSVNAGDLSELMRCAPLQGLAVLGFMRLQGVIPVRKLNRISATWLGGLADKNFRGVDADSARTSHTTNYRLSMMRTIQ